VPLLPSVAGRGPEQESEMADKRRQTVNVVATVVVIAANAWACLWVWNPKPLRWASPSPIDTISVFGTMSLAQVMQLLTGIAVVVHLALLAFAIYQAQPAQREDPLQRRIGNLYARVCWINVACVVIGSVVHPARVMFLPIVANLLLFPAVLIGLVVLIVTYARRRAEPTPATPARIWLVAVPLALYLGWFLLFMLMQLALSVVSIYPG